MADVDDVINYVMNVPHDTNPNVLRQMLTYNFSTLPRVTSEDDGKTMIASNGNWVVSENRIDSYSLGFVTPEQFGAIGDGETNDTAAIQAAIDTHIPVKFGYGKTYIVLDFTLYNGCKIFGNGATLKRPNLKEPPYNYTDSQIADLIMFNLNSAHLGPNTDDLWIELHDLTLDFNGFEMWTPGTGQDTTYEQGVGIRVVGNKINHRKLLIDNCTFLNNYTSNISIANYSDIIITNSKSINCYKGICTIIGSGGNLQISNCFCNSDYNFTAFWYEPNNSAEEKANSKDPPHDNPQDNFSTVNISNCVFYGGFQGLSNTFSYTNITNTIIKTNYVVVSPRKWATYEFNQVQFIATSTNESFMKIRGYGNALFNNCIFTSDLVLNEDRTVDTSAYQRGIFFSVPNNDLQQTVIVYFNNCYFYKLLYACAFPSSQTYAKQTVSFNHCFFKDITNRVFGSALDAQNGYFKSCTISNCIFDVEGYIAHFGGSGNKIPTFNGGNNIINNNNQGIYGYGRNTIIFKNEIWDVPVLFSRWRTGSDYKFRGIGKRTTLLTEPPTFIGLNDIDYAELTVSPYTKYKYINNAWEEIE